MQVKTYEEIFGRSLTIRDLVDGFDEDTKTGRVRAFSGRLNVRPAYQREFIYENEAQQAVIDTVMKGYPLNVMYWAKSPENSDSEYEVMDGQQRILSICKYHDVQQVYPVLENGKKKNLTFEEFDDRQTEQFMNYPLTVYICDGTEAEKLAWFRTINIAGVKLTDQEMRNAIFTSPWVTDAKKYFSSVKGEGFLSEGHVSNGHSYGDYTDAIGGANSEKEKAVCRQYLLETVLSWATDRHNRENNLTGRNRIDIDEYMRLNRKKPNAVELWRYYEDVMEWVKTTFSTYNPIMKQVNWGSLYNEFHDRTVADADRKAARILESGKEISNPKEAYHAVLADDMKWINARAFSETDRSWAYGRQKGICPYCHKQFEMKQMHGDHIVPWSKGGKTDRENLQMLCTECNIKKSNYDVAFRPWDGESYQIFDAEKWDRGDYDPNLINIID